MRRSSALSRRLAFAALALALTIPPPARAADPAPPSGRDVMVAVDARPRGEDQRSTAVWRLIEPSGAERVRETRNYWRDAKGEHGLHSQRLIVFDAPPDVKDTAFLVWSAKDPSADDQQWIYLPALRKVRRIATGDRGNSFVGTDFLYDDLAERTPDADENVWLRREPIDGVPHDVIESTPKGDSPYAKRLQWVNPQTHTIPRIDYYAKSGELEKTLEVRWEQTGGIWVWKRLEMTDLRTKHRTVVEIDQTKVNLGLGEDVFTENAMRLGAP